MGGTGNPVVPGDAAISHRAGWAAWAVGPAGPPVGPDVRGCHGQRSGATASEKSQFWGSELFYAPEDPGQDPRHVGTLEPVWNLYDLTPEGRGTDWDEQLNY